MGTRNRLTDQAVVDVKKAESALLVKSKGGYRVDLCRDDKCVRLIDKIARAVVYPSKDAAKRALMRHNPGISIDLKSRLGD